jgi:formyltetrahydrofolate deformylase
VECPDEQGLISRITGVLHRHHFNIESNHEFVDRSAGRFFMRTEFIGSGEAGPAVEEIETLLPPGACVRLAHRGDRKIVVLVTREHHCLAELLVRHAYDELGASIEAVIGNHAVLAPLAAKFEIPFYHVPYEDRPPRKAEAELQEILSVYEPDYIVMAKFMRILTPEFIAQYPNRIINIHHSFLPAFVGARPYQQAFERGVKIIGATAHFTTTDLDEGPIISQSVIPVHHSHSPEDMAQAGRDIEKSVLARALKLILEERVFLSGKRTIVFD